MENSSSSSTKYTVSRSRGKQHGESRYATKLREARKARGQTRSSDESEVEEEIEQNAVILHKMFNRKVVYYPDNIVVKSGKRIAMGEAEALKVAAEAGIPVPHVHSVRATSEGERQIRMDYVSGEPLDELWPNMSIEQKKDMTRQLRNIIEKMRSVTPPPNLISACDGIEIRDTRQRFTYHSTPCYDESAFNEFLLSTLYEHVPPLVRAAFTQRLRTDHRIVFSHCDLAPRNILVKDGRIQGLVDWEDSGWYPEYWEYVKFFQRVADKDWKGYAEDIFPQLYQAELVDFIAISAWQNS